MAGFDKIVVRATYMCQSFGVRDVCGQTPKSIYGDFPNIFS